MASPKYVKVAGRESFIGPEDMQWLRDVHVPDLPAKYKSAIIFGNEDWPELILAYDKEEPEVTDRPAMYVPVEQEEE